MPKTPIDYSKTIIYKLCCKNPEITDIYIGHTTNHTKRKQNHKGRCCNSKDKLNNTYVYEFIRQNENWENWDMIEIEKYPCNDRLEAKKRERYWIEETKASLNKQLPTRKIKEWYKENRNELLEKKKEYYKINKGDIAKNKKEYYKIYKETLANKNKEYRKSHKEELATKTKEYYKNHKEELGMKSKEYRKSHKEELAEYNKTYRAKQQQLFICACGSNIKCCGETKHFKTKKHQEFLNQPLQS